jgi:hypothetical protein
MICLTKLTRPYYSFHPFFEEWKLFLFQYGYKIRIFLIVINLNILKKWLKGSKKPPVDTKKYKIIPVIGTKKSDN